MKIKRIFFLFILIFATGCITKSINQKGNIFDDNDVREIKVGLTNRENVVKILGYPINQSYFDNNLWIYYSYQIKEVMFFKPKITNQKVLAIQFNNETDIVSDMSLYDINSENYEILNDIDDNIDKDKNNIIQDILRNIGQISM